MLQVRLLLRLPSLAAAGTFGEQGAASRTQLLAHVALVILLLRRFRRRRRCRAEFELLSGCTSCCSSWRAASQRALECQYIRMQAACKALQALCLRCVCCGPQTLAQRVARLPHVAGTGRE